ncbi:GNAT family N-acetyltransferase [Saccharopolyspora dendranthemae]|uniref:RimJ/RimL family protein N-acetyltransferase n=1 Tax=Saccharopolyspora dendranthemae TaxID=1181886 RepID=A0A561U704_9PSEU|nr:GNAT family N-acetyltransferase [Saccharopolyspora dendranthemae]TWF95154.1 RimJ/RimL family protein N-acetyltransferase [Saccharopolyspora dendranthemae]
MTPSEHRRAHPDWNRELVELAALLLVVGATNLALAGVAGHPAATFTLMATGMALLVVALVRWWSHRDAAIAEVPEPEPAFVPQNLWRLRARVTDVPGRLAELAGALAALGGDIRTMQVHPVAGGAVDEVLLHLPTRVRQVDLVAAVETAGGYDVSASRADVRELDDVPTRTAVLANDLVNGRTDLVRGLRSLLGHVEAQWQDDSDVHPVAETVTETAMRLAEPGGGVLVLTRPGGAFTPAEFARARALADLATSCRARVRSVERAVTTYRGIELMLRSADRTDVDLVVEFHERCSSAARFRRYFSAGPAQGERGLRRLLTPALGRSLLALGPDGQVVGMGNLMYDGDSGELALLVRDDWQRRGVGAALAEDLVEQAARMGITTLTAESHVDNTAIARTLRRAGMKLVGAPEPGEWSWTRDLAPLARTE